MFFLTFWAKIHLKKKLFLNLILDEISNNLDLETKEHIIQVLRAYPGAMIVISHDADFLEEIGVDEVVNVEKFKC